MSQLRDEIEQLERRLDKPGLTFLNRRLLLRDFFGAVQATAFAEGHHEGICDAQDAKRAESEEVVVPVDEGEQQ